MRPFLSLLIDMGSINDSTKIIEMSEQEIDVLKTIIDELDLSDEDIAAITYALNLIVLGLSVRNIAIFLGYSNRIGFNTYIKKNTRR